MIRKYPVLAFALAALAAFISIAGCGADDSEEASLTKAQFAKQADLICSDAANEQAEKAAVYLKKHPKADEAEMMGPVAVPPLEKELGELQELGLPRGHEAEAEAFIEEFEKALGEFKEDPEAAVSPGGNPFEKATRLAEKYEYGDCSQSP
jgi:hypothetical protein